MPIAQQTGDFLLNLLKGLGRQAVGKPIGVGQEIARKVSGVSPEEFRKRQEQATQQGLLGKILGGASKAGSLTEAEAQDPLMIPKAYAGQAAFLVPGAKGASTLAKAGAGATSGALSGFGASTQGSEIASTAGGAAIGGATGLAFGLAGKLASKLKSLPKKPPTITGAKLPSSSSFTTSKKAMEKAAQDIGIRDTMRSADKLNLSVNQIGKSQDELNTLLRTSKPVNGDKLLDKFALELQDTEFIDNTPNQRAFLDNLMGRIERSGGDNVSLNNLKSELRSELGSAFTALDKGTSPAVKDQAKLALWKAIKSTFDDVSPEVRKINDFQKTLYDLVDEFVPAVKKSGQKVNVKLPGIIDIVDVRMPTPLSKEAFSQGVEYAGSAGSWLANQAAQKAGLLDKLPQPIKNALIAQIAGQTEQPQAVEQPPVDQMQQDQTQAPPLDPQRQKALDIIDQAEAQGIGGGVTGYSVPQLTQAYAQAIKAGDKGAVAKLGDLLDLETKYQESQAAVGKQLPAGEVSKLAETKVAIRLLPELQKEFDESKGVFGPVMGSVRGTLPYDTRAKKAKATIFLVKQIIGKGLEGGVLRKEDEYKYAEILPKLSDTQETAQNKINLLNQVLNQKYETTVSTFQTGGYDPFGGGKPVSDVEQLQAILSAQGVPLQ